MIVADGTLYGLTTRAVIKIGAAIDRRDKLGPMDSVALLSSYDYIEDCSLSAFF